MRPLKCLCLWGCAVSGTKTWVWRYIRCQNTAQQFIKLWDKTQINNCTKWSIALVHAGHGSNTPQRTATDWISIPYQSHTNHNHSPNKAVLEYDSLHWSFCTNITAHAAGKAFLHHPSLHLSGSWSHHGSRVLLQFMSCFRPTLHGVLQCAPWFSSACCCLIQGAS